MSDKRKAVRNHITAAKTWLSQAENSIDKENDLRSDLDLMLAQAELQRAQETKQRKLWQRWVKRLAPLGAALLVGVAYVLFLRPELIGSQPEEGQLPATEQVQAGVQAGTAGMVQEPDRQAEPKLLTSSEDPGQLTGPGAGIQDGAQPQAETILTDLPEKPPVARDAVPDAEMQKLMQHAGKTLRE